VKITIISNLYPPSVLGGYELYAPFIRSFGRLCQTATFGGNLVLAGGNCLGTEAVHKKELQQARKVAGLARAHTCSWQRTAQQTWSVLRALGEEKR